ncbi:CASP-like protein [Drosera capensis]
MSTSEKIEPTPPPITLPPPPPPSLANCLGGDVVLRFLLLATSIIAVVVMATSKQTVVISRGIVPFPVYASAKFTDSPAFIYFIVGLSVAGFYAILTILASSCLVFRRIIPANVFLSLAAFDAIILGVVASAMGTAGGVAYIGWKGNNHIGWVPVCYIYSKFCRYIAVSLSMALFASVILVILIILNTSSLYLRAPKF